ncbi:hypothetical protein GS429_12505 [Natronorubrum sp. JWXQ-INN-674]|uniref:Lipoprotein n=1 Tax=Natronorubrum halalkaliphilum TaxID=2691917 RepID=A0A6B0VQ13_9EURY|nr:hypothetical protein [Natronorubrum halalkaliphilum]MXV62872.1 hypothetical protein [Natronorubrum halalkaliphilum]
MSNPRSRRTLLTAALPFTMAISGCFDAQFTGADTPSEPNAVSGEHYDCDDVDRPEPDMPTRDRGLERASYPDRPDAVVETGDEYALEFERAYRQNALLERYGSETRAFDFQLEASRIDVVESELSAADSEAEEESTRDSESEANAVLVSMLYDLTTETQQLPKSTERDTRVTYYLDETVVLRARYHGLADEPSFDPDPRTAGDPVACFE